MENLFNTTKKTKQVEEKLWEKTAEMGTFYISSDPNHWTKDILTNFYEKFPFLQEVPMGLNWKKKDGDRGIAVGSLELLGGAVPVIIEGFEVAPLDVMLVGDMAFPLTERIVKTLFDNVEAFEGLKSSSGKATEKIFQDDIIDVPLDRTGSTGRGSTSYTSRPAEKTASVIDNIQTVDQEDVISLLEACNEDSISFKKLAEQGNDTLLKTIAEKAQMSKIASKGDLELSLDIDRHYKFKDDNGNWILKQANSQYTKEWEIRLTPQEAAEFDNYETNTITQSSSADTGILDTVKEAEEQNLKLGSVAQFTTDNKSTPVLTIKGISENKNPQKLASFKSFDGNNYILSDKATWNTQNDLVKQAAVSAEPFETLDKDLDTKQYPTKGDYGSFVWEGHMTPPAEVIKVAKDQSNVYDKAQVKTFDGFKTVEYQCTDFNQSQGFSKVASDKVIIPSTAKWVTLGDYDESLNLDEYKPGEIKLAAYNESDLTDNTVYLSKEAQEIKQLSEREWLVPQSADFNLPKETTKTASVKPKANTVYKDTTGLYSLIGDKFEKYASVSGKSVENLTKPEAIWTAIHLGAVSQDVQRMEKMASRSYWELKGKLDVPVQLDQAYEKIASQREESMGNRIVTTPHRDLVKVAAYFRRKGSVDAILSLGLLRKGNARQYLSAIPAYETVLSELARLLIASRLGLEGTDPDVIKDAMMSLTEVLHMMKSLNTTVEGVN